MQKMSNVMQIWFSGTILNKAVVDIRLRLRCAILPPPLRLTGCIAGAQKFSECYLHWLAYWMISSAAWGNWRLNDAAAPKVADAFDWYRQPRKLPLPLGESAPHPLHGLWAHWVSIQNGISICSAIFAQLTVECPITLQWAATFPPKLPIPLGHRVLHLTHGT